MARDERFPEYDWIQDIIDDLNKINQDLRKTYLGNLSLDSKIIAQDPLVRFKDVYKEMKEFIVENGLPISLSKINFSVGGIEYLAITDARDRLQGFINYFAGEHLSNLEYGIKYSLLIDFDSC